MVQSRLWGGHRTYARAPDYPIARWPEKDEREREDGGLPRQRRAPQLFNLQPRLRPLVALAIDKALGDAIAKTPYLKEYMSTLFTLKSGDKPHELKF